MPRPVLLIPGGSRGIGAATAKLAGAEKINRDRDQRPGHVRPRRKIVDHRQERQRGPRRQQRDVEHAPMPHAQRMTIDQPNHVWCADVTYIPMRRGFLYLVAIMDWASRKVLAWRLSNTMDAEFCVRRWRMRSLASASPTSSTPIRARSSPASPSPTL